MNGFRRLTPKIVLAATALALLPACSPRQPIPSTPGDARPEAEVRAERQHQAPRRSQPAQSQGPVEETVVAEVRDPQTTDAQIKTAVAKTEARHADPLDEALAEEAAKDHSQQEQAAASKPAEADHAAEAGAAKPAETKGKEGATNETAPAESATKGLMVQIASFGAEKNADAAMAWLKDMGYAKSRKVPVGQGGTAYVRVQAGPFQDQAAARKALEQLKADWPQAFIPAD